MEFLSPLYLLAGAAAAIPLLIHLLRRRIGTRIDFPATRYLLRAEKEHSRRLRLRNLLLMLLRVAIVALVVLAAARPFLRLGGSGHAPTALAIVLDNSLSTSAIVGGRPVLEVLKERARIVASRASRDDRVWLVTADGSVRGGGEGAEAVLEAIEHTEPLAGAGDIARALTRAASLVRGGGRIEREIAVVTDGQESGWRELPSLGNVRVVVHRVEGEPPTNRAVVQAEAVPVRWTPRGAVRASVLTPDSVTYRIELEGRTLARGSAARDEEIMVRASPGERGWAAGTVELEPDELRGDDIRHFAAWIGPAPAVNVHPSAGQFARSAVDALVQLGRAVYGGDVQIAPADEARARPALLLAPTDPVRIGAANRNLERMGIPWRFGARRAGESLARAVGETPPLEGVSVSQRWVLERRGAEASDTLAMVGGDAWIVAGADYVLIGSPMTPDATSLPIRAAFVPLLGAALGQRLAGGGDVIHAGPGATIGRPSWAETLELQAGQRMPLVGDSLVAPDRPGVYWVSRGEERVGAVVVNAEPEASVLDRLDLAALTERVRASDVRAAGSGEELERIAFSSSPRRALLLPLLVLAIGTLIVEGAIAGSAGRSGGSEG